MSDIVNFKNGGAIDARFQAIDVRIDGVIKNQGEYTQELKELKDGHAKHAITTAEHKIILDSFTKATDKLISGVSNLTRIVYVGVGIGSVVSVLFGAAVTYLFSRL